MVEETTTAFLEVSSSINRENNIVFVFNFTDTRNYMSIPKLSFTSLQNLMMSSLTDEADDNYYNDQTKDSYQNNGYHSKRTDNSYNYVKRGIGQCIFNCLKRPGQMNFIQCRSMCH